jgi:hypothetical protein
MAMERQLRGSTPTDASAPGISSNMILLVRTARVVLILLAAVFTLSLIIGLGSPTTGLLEKPVLAALIALCIVLAAKITSAATALQDRLRHRSAG